MYYKLIDGLNIVGVVSLDDFRRYKQKHGFISYSDIDSAQYVEYNGEYFRANWLRPTTTDEIAYRSVDIVRIEEAEYNALKEAFETNQVIAAETQEEEIQEPEQIEESPDTTIEFIRDAKIAQLSKICHDTITNGVDVVLSDNETHHFSMTLEDQMQIQALVLRAQSGEEVLFWHEDGKPCQFFPAQDIISIYRALEEKTTYNTTYFNSLKMYVLSLGSIDEISEVKYGMQVPRNFQSEVFQYLYGQQINGEENGNL